MNSTTAIGVFDSGMGGLTVLKALQAQLPNERFIYLGDTARLPYGTKSQDTIIHYAKKMTDTLLAHDIKLLVIACNSATAAALPELQQAHPELPIIGVIEPGARAAVAASTTQHIGVLATEATANSGIYQHTITQLTNAASVWLQPCPLFVALAEEGCVADPITDAVIAKYLAPLLQQDPKLDCILLGCTHFPVLLPSLRRYIPKNITIIDSAITVANSVQMTLDQHQLHTTATSQSPTQYLVTDLPERFSRIGSSFLGKDIPTAAIRLIAP